MFQALPWSLARRDARILTGARKATLMPTLTAAGSSARSTETRPRPAVRKLVAAGLLRNARRCRSSHAPSRQPAANPAPRAFHSPSIPVQPARTSLRVGPFPAAFEPPSSSPLLCCRFYTSSSLVSTTSFNRRHYGFRWRLHRDAVWGMQIYTGLDDQFQSSDYMPMDGQRLRTDA